MNPTSHAFVSTLLLVSWATVACGGGERPPPRRAPRPVSDAESAPAPTTSAASVSSASSADR